MKYKNLTIEQIIISLDRLTRFKNTREKYLRVYSDILISSLIEPKLKKSDIECMDFSVITDYVSEIFNGSVYSLLSTKDKNNFTAREQESSLLSFIRDYENNIFVNDNETQKLLNNSFDYDKVIKLLPNDCPINLKWLREIAVVIKSSQIQSVDCKTLKDLRNDKKLKFPIEKVLLVEGITEEILLPTFAKFLDYDFYAHGIQIIPAGGKNQVVKMYYKLAKELKIPIFVLLDHDAEDNINQINPRLRSIDKIHLVSCGEFEDLLPKSLIAKTTNSHFKNFMKISESDLLSSDSTVKALEEIFKTKGLHEFKKAEFAKLVREQIATEDDISPEIKAIVAEIEAMK